MSREEQTWNGEGGSLRQKEPWVMIDGGEKAHESGGDHRHPSPPVRGWLISKWELGTDKPRASGQRSRLGYSEVFCTAREIMAGSLHDTPCTLPCYRSKQWNHTSDQSPQESSLLVRQRGHCMLHVRCTLQKGTNIHLWGRPAFGSYSWQKPSKECAVHTLQSLSGTLHQHLSV